jgi:hypothetical protein
LLTSSRMAACILDFVFTGVPGIFSFDGEEKLSTIQEVTNATPGFKSKFIAKSFI